MAFRCSDWGEGLAPVATEATAVADAEAAAAAVAEPAGEQQDSGASPTTRVGVNVSPACLPLVMHCLSTGCSQIPAPSRETNAHGSMPSALG